MGQGEQDAHIGSTSPNSKMPTMLVLVLLLVATTAAKTAPTASSSSARDPAVLAPSTTKNVLFIAVDDMRPSINAFNFSLAHTPNLDQLAAEGLTFKRAFVNYVSGSTSWSSSTLHTPNSVTPQPARSAPGAGADQTHQGSGVSRSHPKWR